MFWRSKSCLIGNNKEKQLDIPEQYKHKKVKAIICDNYHSGILFEDSTACFIGNNNEKQCDIPEQYKNMKVKAIACGD